MESGGEARAWNLLCVCGAYGFGVGVLILTVGECCCFCTRQTGREAGPVDIH